MVKTYLILEAFTPQGQSIAGLLRKHKCGRIIKCNQVETDIPEGAQVIPTGANSTYNHITKYGDLTIGEITFTKESLVVYDKLLLLKKAQEVGIPVPEQYNSIREINSYPVFYKNQKEQSDKIRGIAYTENEVRKLPDRPLIFQEVINQHSTIGFGFLAAKGEVLTYFCQKEIISQPKSGGTGMVIEQYKSEAIINYTTRLLKAINYSGWGLAEFKYCPKRNDYVLMEINGKFWASLEFSLKCNTAFAQQLFHLAIRGRRWHKVFFLNHLIKSGFKQFFQAFKYFFSAKILWKQNLFYYFSSRIRNRFNIDKKTIEQRSN